MCPDDREICAAHQVVDVGAVLDSEAQRQGQAGCGPTAGQVTVEFLVEVSICPGDAPASNTVDKAFGDIGDEFHARVIGRGRVDEDRCQVARTHRSKVLASFLGRQVGNNRAIDACTGHALGEGIDAVGEEDVVVGHEQERNVEAAGAFFGELEAAFDR